MAYKSKNYTPEPEGQAILARAMELIKSIPYRATSRWTFYPLLQEGYYHATTSEEKRREYVKFLALTSRARHNGYGEWAPDTLADDTREAREHEDGYSCAKTWAEGIAQGIRPPHLDHWYSQETYVEVWFEAAAMRAQFEYYTKDTTMRPFQGAPSIDYKWQIAKSLEESEEKYELPIVILYFGDYDTSGKNIPKTAETDIRKWCSADFEFIRAGLNAGDGARFGIPENFDKPGTYQWEALSDAAARELITGAVNQYVDSDIITQLERESLEAGQKFNEFVKAFVM